MSEAVAPSGPALAALRHGAAWSPEEDRRLEIAHRDGATPEDLARLHARGAGAIRARLERLGLTAAAGGSPAPLPAAVDALVAALATLRQQAQLGMPSRRAIAAVARDYDRLDALLIADPRRSDAAPDAVDAADGDPLPDRLRAAFIGIINACIADPTDRAIVHRTLGLEGDGEPVTLAQLGRDFDRSGERMRQRRDRSYRTIAAVLPRRVASAARLRVVLADVAADADWTDAATAARMVVSLVNDRVAAAQQLVLMVLRAAGASGTAAALRREAEAATLAAVRDPATFGRWRLDRWADAAAAAILPGTSHIYDAPPADMTGAQRMPGESRGAPAIMLPSGKLGRSVACESGMEHAVYRWLERSPEVRWYQEQPIAIPYAEGDRLRSYYPDAAVWDRDGRVLVVEVKPAFFMYRRATLLKALAAVDALHARGIGYLLVDSRGRTLRDLAACPYDVDLAARIEREMDAGPVPFGTIRHVAGQHVAGTIDFAPFASMVVNRDWDVSDVPVRVSRLEAGLSFRALLASPD